MKTPQQEIEIAQQDLKEIHARLSNFLRYYWDYRALAIPEQVEAADTATTAINEAVAQLEILKEAMR